MKKTYNIGDLVRFREEELYAVLVTAEGKDMMSFGKPLCITLDHDDLLSPEA